MTTCTETKMKVRTSVLIFAVVAVALLATEIAGRDLAEERRLRRGRREGRKTRRLRLRRTRNNNNHHRRREHALSTSTLPQELDDWTTTSTDPPVSRVNIPRAPDKPEDTFREAAIVKQHMGVKDILNQNHNNENEPETRRTPMFTPDSESVDDSAETDSGNMTWSGDHDVVSVNGTLLDSDRTPANATRNATTPKPARTTPDPSRVALWRMQQR